MGCNAPGARAFWQLCAAPAFGRYCPRPCKMCCGIANRGTTRYGGRQAEDWVPSPLNPSRAVSVTKSRKLWRSVARPHCRRLPPARDAHRITAHVNRDIQWSIQLGHELVAATIGVIEQAVESRKSARLRRDRVKPRPAVRRRDDVAGQGLPERSSWPIGPYALAGAMMKIRVIEHTKGYGGGRVRHPVVANSHLARRGGRPYPGLPT